MRVEAHELKDHLGGHVIKLGQAVHWKGKKNIKKGGCGGGKW